MSGRFDLDLVVRDSWSGSMFGRFELAPTTTVGDLLLWSYANLCMAHAAVSDGASSYGPKYYAIRTRLHKGFLTGTSKFRPFDDDERVKMVMPQACSYCGSAEKLSIDHLVPRHRVVIDAGENMVWACRPCNSSKNAADLLEWYGRKGDFPPLLLLRRYLKIAHRHAQAAGLLDLPIVDVQSAPFRYDLAPIKFPPPSALKLWVVS
jgi:hypothetical protein